MSTTRRLSALFIVVAGFVSAMAFMTPTAAAVSCSGTGCDGGDPVNSGCGNSSVTSQHISTPKGDFYLKYSTVCKTNWVLVPNYAGGSSRPDNKLQLYVEDAGRKGVSFWAPSTPGTHYGNMVYSPGTRCAIGAADWQADATWEVVLRSSSC
jgi:hypothetical protein